MSLPPAQKKALDISVERNKPDAMTKTAKIAKRLIRGTPGLDGYLTKDSVVLDQIKRLNTQSSGGGSPGGLTGSRIYKRNPNSVLASILKEKRAAKTIDWPKIVEELENKLEKEKEKVEDLQDEIQKRNERFVVREEDYRKVIERLENDLRGRVMNDTGERNQYEIKNLYGQITNKIDTLSNKTAKILKDQEKDIIKFFNSKIQEIKKQYEIEAAEQAKLGEEYKQKEHSLINELEWIKTIAQRIDEENQNLNTKYSKVKSLYSIQENDKNILIKDIILKKKKNQVLSELISNFESVVQQVDSQFLQRGGLAQKRSSQGSRFGTRGGFNSTFRSDERQKSFMGQTLEDDSVVNNLKANLQRAEGVIAKLQSTIAKDRSRLKKLRNVYIKEMESKTIIEGIVRKTIDDIREDLTQLNSKTKTIGRSEEILTKKQRSELIDKLNNDEQLMSVIYDKAFFTWNKSVKIPQEFLEDADDEIEQFEKIENKSINFQI